MIRNKNLDPELNENLHQHFEVQPRPEFLSTLKSDLMNQAAAQRTQAHQRKTRKTALVMAGVMAALALILFITPVREAIGQIFVELFQEAESNVLPYPPAQTAIAERTAAAGLAPTNTPEATRTPDPSGYRGANMSVEEVEQAAGFDVLVPASVPMIFKFHGASYLPDENVSILFYDLVGRNTNGMSIAQEPITNEGDCDLCSDIGPDANVNSVKVGDADGEYVVGGWHLENGNRIWGNNPWNVTLRWQTGDTVYQIFIFGPPMTLSKSDMINIAESMASSNEPLAWYGLAPTATPQQDAVRTPDPANVENATMSLDEVREAAGYEILTPSYLAGQDFSAANYDEETNIVYLFYGEELLLRQEPFTSMVDCQLCIETRYGAEVRQVMVGDVEAEYLFGAWKYTDPNNLDFTVPQPKQLRWQENNTFFDLIYDHDPSEMSLDDLIAIAESLQ
jgi:hypothetical protein